MSTFRSPGSLCLLLSLVAAANGDKPAAVGRQGQLPPGAVARVGLLRLIHAGGVSALHFAANGKRLISVGEDDEVRIWDLVLGAEVHSWHVKTIRNAGFAPDGNTLATRSGKDTVTVWTAAGRQLAKFDVGPDQSLSSLSLSPDGKQLVGASDTGVILTWDIASGKREQLLQLNRGRRPYTIALSADGSRAVTVGNDHVLSLRELATGNVLLSMTGHKGRVQTVELSPDMRYLASQEALRDIHLWDLATGKQIAALPDHNPTFVLSPDGRTMATGGSAIERVRLWDLSSGRERAQLKQPGGIECLTFSQDGRYLAAGGKDGVIRIWETRPDQEPVPVAGVESAMPVAFHDGGRTLAVYTGTSLSYWDLEQPKQSDRPSGTWNVRQRPRRSEGLNDILAFAPDGKTAVASSGRQTLAVIDVATGAELRSLGKGSNFSSAVFSPDGKNVAAFVDRDIKAWDVVTGKELFKAECDHDNQDRQHAYPVAGKLLFVGGGHFEFLDRAMPRKMQELTRGRPFALAADGQVLATGGQSKDEPAICLWEIATGQTFATLPGCKGLAQSLLFAPDGRALASETDNTILLWDTSLERLGKANPARPEPAELVRCWKALAAADAVAAHEAMGYLVRHPTASLPFLRERLQPMLAPPAERIDVLIAQLDADAFKAREEAYQELRKLGKLAEPQIRQALAKKPSLDVQLPLGRLVEELEITSFGVPPGDCLRGIRAVRVLAALDTPEARQHLERLAQGAKAAILTQRAQAALERLPRKKVP